VKRGSTNLFKVRLEGSLAGPRPLHIKGKATFEILWWDVSIRVDKKLVEGQRPAAPPPIEIMPRLKEALDNGANWVSRLPAGQRQMVTVRARPAAAGEVILHPLGTLEVKQQVVPLNMEITRFGQAAPAGETRFEITRVGVGVDREADRAEELREFFAPGQFVEMSDDEKLSWPSFEEMVAGVRIGSEEVRMTSERTDWVEVKAIDYETVIVDKGRKEARRNDPGDPDSFYRLRKELLGRQAGYGAAGMSELRRSGRGKYRTVIGKHSVTKEGWRIVAKEDLRAVGEEGRGYTQAAEELKKLKETDPVRAAGMKIMRLSELG
jgi:hypothetical protein